MYHPTHVITQDEESTMVPPFVAPRIVPIASKSILPTRKKSWIQVNFKGRRMAPLFKAVTVPTFKKKNGTVVVSHQHQVRVHKKSSTSKSARVGANHGTPMFSALEDCKESVSLAHSIHIQELQILMRGEPNEVNHNAM
jgi:hypothetical protein